MRLGRPHFGRLLLTAHQVIEDDAKVMSPTSRSDSTITPGRVQISRSRSRAGHALTPGLAAGRQEEKIKDLTFVVHVTVW